jgi:hypothetical protein
MKVIAAMLVLFMMSSVNAYYCPYGQIVVDASGTYRCVQTYTPMSKTAIIVTSVLTGLILVTLFGVILFYYLRRRRIRNNVAMMPNYSYHPYAAPTPVYPMARQTPVETV